MTDVWNLWPVDGWQRFAADAAWQGLLVGLGAAIAIRLARHRPALRAARRRLPRSSCVSWCQGPRACPVGMTGGY